MPTEADLMTVNNRRVLPVDRTAGGTTFYVSTPEMQMPGWNLGARAAARADDSRFIDVRLDLTGFALVERAGDKFVNICDEHGGIVDMAFPIDENDPNSVMRSMMPHAPGRYMIVGSVNLDLGKTESGHAINYVWYDLGPESESPAVVGFAGCKNKFTYQPLMPDGTTYKYMTSEECGYMTLVNPIVKIGMNQIGALLIADEKYTAYIGELDESCFVSGFAYHYENGDNQLWVDYNEGLEGPFSGDVNLTTDTSLYRDLVADYSLSLLSNVSQDSMASVPMDGISMIIRITDRWQPGMDSEVDFWEILSRLSKHMLPIR